MNREQRRKAKKQIQKYNLEHKDCKISLQDYEMQIALERLKSGNLYLGDLNVPKDFVHKDNTALFPDGTKVKLNYERIFDRFNGKTKDFDKNELAYKKWVESHKEQELTITREGAQRSLVCIAEDDTSIDAIIDENGKELRRERWLFDLYTDLLIYDKETDKYVLAWEIESKEEQKTASISQDGEANNSGNDGNSAEL